MLLHSQGLGTAPTGKLDLSQLIHNLGYVQLDTIQIVSRAHHHIIWSRNNNYRETMLNKHLKARNIFEHFTHDASVLPMEFYPYWRGQFERLKNRVEASAWFKKMPNDAGIAAIKDRIAEEGALSTHAFQTKIEGKKEMWSRPPHKHALDYLWFSGELSTCHRDGFTKHYDLSERVIPKQFREQKFSHANQVDWLCRAALERLGAGTLTEVRCFWDATSVDDAKRWAARSDVVPVEIEGHDRSTVSGIACADIEEKLATLTPPTSRLRILNPFDPVVRDRKRLHRLFGFEYRVEMFVPKAKRKWGYYIFPILEGDRFIARLEAKAHRKSSTLVASKIWVEPRVNWTERHDEKLGKELVRLARLANCKEVTWTPKST